MSAFRKALAQDIKTTFFNVDEFCEVHDLNGYSVPCVIETDESKDAGVDQIGVSSNRLKVYVPLSEIPTPCPSSQFSVDGSMHLVQSASVEMGVLVIRLEEFS